MRHRTTLRWQETESRLFAGRLPLNITWNKTRQSRNLSLELCINRPMAPCGHTIVPLLPEATSQRFLPSLDWALFPTSGSRLRNEWTKMKMKKTTLIFRSQCGSLSARRGLWIRCWRTSSLTTSSRCSVSETSSSLAELTSRSLPSNVTRLNTSTRAVVTTPRTQSVTSPNEFLGQSSTSTHLATSHKKVVQRVTLVVNDLIKTMEVCCLMR